MYEVVGLSKRDARSLMQDDNAIDKTVLDTVKVWGVLKRDERLSRKLREVFLNSLGGLAMLL